MANLRRFVAILVCCSLSPVALLAQGAGAMLYATGQVTVNGHAAGSSSAIFPGDHVQVGPNSSASISSPGVSAQVSSGTTVTWQQRAINFQSGSVNVSGQAPSQVHIGDVTVSLGPEASQVEVIQREDVALVKLLKGSATLNEAGQTTALKIGFTVARPHTMTTAAGSATSTPPAPVAHSSHLGIIAVAAGGAAAAGIGLGLRGHKDTAGTPVSPSAP